MNSIQRGEIGNGTSDILEVVPPPSECVNPFLGDGTAGIAIAQITRFTQTNDEIAKLRAIEYIEHALDTIVALDATSSFYSGSVGVGWALVQIDRVINQTTTPDLCKDLDDALLAYLRSDSWDGNVDLIHGIAGILVYALDHSDERTGLRIFSAALTLLENAATRFRQQVSWKSPSSSLPESLLKSGIDSAYIIGPSHGTTSLLSIFCGALSRRWECARVAPLHEGLLSWHVEHLRADEKLGFVPYYDGHSGASRFAWCYGDPGTLLAIAISANFLGDPDLLRQTAINATLSWRARSEGGHYISDPYLCHGWSGVALCYQRLASISGNEECYSIAMALWKIFDLELAKTFDFSQIRWRENESRPRSGLLEGAAGLSLAYRSRVATAPLFWERCMLTPGFSI